MALKAQRLKQKLTKASVCSFLNSAMNIEYVHLILQGIDKLMQNQTLIDNISESKKQLIDFKNAAEGRSVITIDKG